MNTKLKLLPLSLIMAVPLFAGEVEFTWNDNSDNETHFELCELDDTGKPIVLKSVPANVTKLLMDSAEVAGRRLAVRAANDFGYSGFSNWVDMPSLPSPVDGLDWKITIQLQAKTQ